MVDIRSNAINILVDQFDQISIDETTKLLTKLMMKWFSNINNIKNAHPLIESFQETISYINNENESNELHEIEIIDKLPIYCFGYIYQTYQTSFILPKEDDITMLWISTIPNFKYFRTNFTIEYNKLTNEFCINDRTSFELNWYMHPLYSYIIYQLKTSHIELLNNACTDIEMQLLNMK